MYGAKIDIPAPLGNVVGVADAVSGLRLLAADFTLLSHDCCGPFEYLMESFILTDFEGLRQFHPGVAS
jgi:hypothetical protein